MNTGIYALALYLAVAAPTIFLFRHLSFTAKKIPLTYLFLVPLPLSAVLAYMLAIVLWPQDEDGGLFFALVFAVLVFIVAVVLSVLVSALLYKVVVRSERP